MNKFAFSIVGIAGIAISAAQVNYSSNFDSLTLGNLATQDNWVAGSGTAPAVPQVTNNASLSPSNSVLVANTGTGSTFMSAGQAMAIGLPAVNTNILTASANIFVSSVGGADRYFGVGFGVSALATGGRIAIALGGNGLRGGGGSYAAFNGVSSGLLQARSTVDFVGRWVNVSLVADRSLTTNNVTYTFSGLGTSTGNATETFTGSADMSAINLTHAQLFTDWDASGATLGSAFIDDVAFGANAVPEPATMTILGVAALIAARRKKA
jgi:hypothetical protein